MAGDVIQRAAKKPPYGAWELKVTYQRNMLFSLALVTGLFATLVLVGWSIGMFSSPPIVVIDNPVIRTRGEFTWEPPPPIEFDNPPVAGGGGRPALQDLLEMVIPKAVPDSELTETDEMLIPTREDQGRIVDQHGYDGDPGEGTDTGSGVAGFGGNGGTGDFPPSDVFQPLEKFPEMISSVQPEYPRLIKDMGVEGSVWVQVLIDTEGKVIKAEILLSSEIQSLDDAALEAAWKNRFSPGIQNDHPVPCWVKYEVKFQLDR